MTEIPKKPIKLPLLADTALTPHAAAYHPKIIVRQGRGRAGGSMTCDLLAETAIGRGQRVIVADGDMRNPTLSLKYPPGSEHGAPRPKSDTAVDGRDWLNEILNLGFEQNASVFIDLGGGDRTLQEWSAGIDFVSLAESLGFNVTGLFFSGPEYDDFAHVLSILQAGYFKPRQSLLVLNEALIENGRSSQGAFDHILNDPSMPGLVGDGMQTLLLPRLAYMDQVKAAGLSFHDAAQNMKGKNGRPFGPAQAFFVKSWLKTIEQRIADAGVESWLP